MAKEEMKEGTPEEEKAESSQEAADEGDIKIPEQFQRDVYALVEQCKNTEQIDFMCSCANQKRQDLNEEDEGFSTAEMPS